MKIVNHTICKELERTALSQKEALVYTAILELGGGFPSKIADYCGLKRSTVYDVLQTLAVRGVVNEIVKKNKIYYQVDKPSRLLGFFKGRVKLAEEGLERVERLLPEIESVYSLLGNRPKIYFFEGPNTIESICDDILEFGKGREMLAFSNAEKYIKQFPENKLRAFTRGKENNRISTRAIFPDTPLNRSYGPKSFKGLKKDIQPSVRFVSPQRFPFQAEISIYGASRVALTKLSGQNIIGVILEDEDLHSMLRMIFELAWESNQVTS